VDDFFTVTRSAVISRTLMRPSPYHIPAYILHLPTLTRIIKDGEEARKQIADQPEYLIQRYVCSGDYTVRKLRTVWSGPKHVSSKIVQKVSEMPYNSPNMPILRVSRRKSSLKATAPVTVAQRRRSQLLTEVPASPFLRPCEDPDLPQVWESDYMVSFAQLQEARILDVGMHDRAPEAMAVVDFLARAAIGGRGKLAAFVLDLVQDWDNQWIFLNLKQVTITNLTDQSELLLEETKTADSPSIDLETIHRSNEALYFHSRAV